MIARRAGSPEDSLLAALSPWERRLTVESAGRWLIRGAVVGLTLASLVLLIGWLVPRPETELRPLALEGALAVVLAAVIVGAWPGPHPRRAAQLDARLGLGDRLATAWAYRGQDRAILRLQRADAMASLGLRQPRSALRWRPARPEVVALGASGLLTALLLVTPSPRQALLDQQAAEQAAVEQTQQQLDALRLQAVQASSLSPDQARQLDDLLRQAQTELQQTHSQTAAMAALARVQDQLNQQLADPNASLRDDALAAMSETLAAEPRTQALADALRREDPRATSDAVKSLAAQADQLSDVERQGLSRALQRAANVGRSEPRGSAALRDAAQAIAAGASADAALSATDSALREAIQASQAQASVAATLQRLRELQTRLASGAPLTGDASPGESDRPASAATSSLGLPSGTPVALDAGGSRTINDPAAGQGQGAGVGAAQGASQAGADAASQAAENIFVPGRAGDGAADSQDLVDQPFSVRGAPRPYREVLSQYAQTSRDYEDRPDISPAVRDLVKQYFLRLQLQADQ